MKNHNKPAALQLKGFTGQVQGVAQPPDKCQGKGFFAETSCWEHSPITASASGTRVRAAAGAGLSKRPHQHPLKNQAPVLPAHQVLTWPCEGLEVFITNQALLLQHLHDYQLAEEWQILDYPVFQNKSPGAQTVHSSALFLISHLGLETQPSDIQTGSTRRDPAKEEEIEWTTAICLVHLLLCTQVLQHFKATQSRQIPGLKTLGKDYLTQPPTQHPAHSHQQPSSGPFLL